MLTYQTVTFTRLELFEKVWSAPLLKVAQEIGISDVALGKACRRNGIPLPRRGYWAKTKTPREKPTPGRLKSPSSEISFQVLDPALVLKYQLPTPGDRPAVHVAETLGTPHELVAATLKRTAKSRLNDGKYDLDFTVALKLKVTPAGLDRASRILDALIKASEATGCTWSVSPGGATVVRLNDQDMKFEMIERVTKQEKPRQPRPAPRKGEDWISNLAFYRPEYEWVSTNKFTITIDERVAVPTRRTWKDTPSGSLESKLGDLVAHLPVLAEAVRHQRAIWAEQARSSRLEEERRLLAKRQAERLRLLRKRLVANMVSWERAVRIRHFCDAVEHRYSAAQNQNSARWIAWSREQANLLDPLSDDPAALLSLDVEVPEWFQGPGNYEKVPSDWWSPAPGSVSPNVQMEVDDANDEEVTG